MNRFSRIWGSSTRNEITNTKPGPKSKFGVALAPVGVTTARGNFGTKGRSKMNRFSRIYTRSTRNTTTNTKTGSNSKFGAALAPGANKNEQHEARGIIHWESSDAQ